MAAKRTSFIDHLQIRVTYGDETLTPETIMDGLAQVTTVKSTVSNLVTVTKPPTANNSTDCNGFTNPNNAHTSNDIYATAVGDIATFKTMYSGFGFAIPAGKKITKVELSLESTVNVGDGTITQSVKIGTPGTPDTCGNFTDYPEGVASGEITSPFTEAVRFFDVTNTGHSFVPSDFDDANLRFALEAFHGVI